MLLNQITVRAHTVYVYRINAVKHEAQASMSVCLRVWSASVLFFLDWILHLANENWRNKSSGKIEQFRRKKNKNNMPFNCCPCPFIQIFYISVLTPAEMLMFQMSQNSTWQCYPLTTCITHCISNVLLAKLVQYLFYSLFHVFFYICSKKRSDICLRWTSSNTIIDLCGLIIDTIPLAM